MMRNRIAVVIATALLLSSLSACGGGGVTPTVGTVRQAGEMHVCRAQTLEIPGTNFEHLQDLWTAGERIYLTGYANSAAQGYRFQMVSFLLDSNDEAQDLIRYLPPASDFGNFSAIRADEEGNLYVFYQTFHYSWQEEMMEEAAEDMEEEAAEETAGEVADGDSVETGVAGNTAEPTGAADADAGTAAPETEPENAPEEEFPGKEIELAPPEERLPEKDKTAVTLIKYTPDGTIVYESPVDDTLLEGEYASLSSVLVADDTVCMAYGGNVALFDAADGAMKSVAVEGSGSYGYYRLTALANGRVLYSGWGNNGQVAQEIDLATGKAADDVPVPESANTDSFRGGTDYDLYFTNSSGLYGLRLGETAAEELFNYIDSDLGGITIEAYQPLSDGRILASVSTDAESGQGMMGGFASTGSEQELQILTKVNADEIAERQEITLGCLYTDSRVTREVVRFNRASDRYRIRIIPYNTLTEDGAYEASSELFHNDIISGNMPDMVVMDPQMSIANYCAKGVFAPLDAYLEQDEELKDVDFLDNVLEPLRYQGKTYTITPGFGVVTIAVKTKKLAGTDRWDMETFERLAEESGLSEQALFGIPFSSSEFLRYQLIFNSSRFVDWNTHRCNFDSGEFQDLLKTAARFPAEADYNSFQYSDMVYREDKALFELTGIYNFESYWQTRYLHFGEEVTFVGFPTGDGEGCSGFMAETSIALSASSQQKDACYEFMRSFYSEDYQDNLSYMLPVRRSSLEKQAEASMQPKTWVNPMTGETEEHSSFWMLDGGMEVEENPLTKEDIAIITELIDGLHVNAAFDQKIMEIIEEDVQPFFEGQKTAEEVASIIQSRVSIYLNENS